jgi:hypothetical protein
VLAENSTNPSAFPANQSFRIATYIKRDSAHVVFQNVVNRLTPIQRPCYRGGVR